jgi:hypothetical protein
MFAPSVNVQNTADPTPHVVPIVGCVRTGAPMDEVFEGGVQLEVQCWLMHVRPGKQSVAMPVQGSASTNGGPQKPETHFVPGPQSPFAAHASPRNPSSDKRGTQTPAAEQ